MNNLKKTRQRGSVLITVAVSLVALLAFLGLALDSGSGYLVKAKLSSAVDGAALAAGAEVKHGANWSEQQANATKAAQAFFNANYPNGTLGTTPTLDSVDITSTAGKVQITVNATARGKVSFMRILGFEQQVIRASAKVTTASDMIDLALIVDQSNSIAHDYSIVQDANMYLLDLYDDVQNRMAIVFFANNSQVMMSPRDPDHGYDKAQAQALLSAPRLLEGETNTPAALKDATSQLLSISAPAPRQAILLFTDGLPQWGRVGQDDAYNLTLQAADQARDQGVMVMTVGFSWGMDNPGAEDRMRCLANAPDAAPSCQQPDKPVGVFCRADDLDSLKGCYQSLMSGALKLTQ